MKSYTEKKEKNKNDKLMNIALNTSNFDEIPPIIGIITADLHGNTILVIEHDLNNDNNYGPIISYLNENDKSLVEIDLVSMYFSSFKIFAGQTNIQNLSHLEIHGSNIKVQIFFLMEKFMIIIFLNSKTQLIYQEQKDIINYFKELLMRNEQVFNNFNNPNARKILRMQKMKGRSWLKRVNIKHLQIYKKNYLDKFEIIERLIESINPIIQTELIDYLKNVPDELIINISKEIINKIQDKLFNQYS